MTQALITRRDKVVAAWLNQVCPAVDPVLAADGAFTFTNAAVAARAAGPAESYQLQWFRFDNAAGTRTPVGGRETVAAPGGPRPGRPPRLGRVRRRRGDGAFTRSARDGRDRRRSSSAAAASGWTLVGVERG